MKFLKIILLSSFILSFAQLTNAKIPEVILSKKSAVVSIYIEDKGKIIAGGSGFIIDPNGVIVTNAHVIEPWNKSKAGILYVKKSDGTFLEQTEIIAMDAVKDVATIRVKDQNLPFIKLTSNFSPTQGDDVVVIGNPLGLETTVSNGIISAIRGEDGFLQISAPISQGSSGSPVLNNKGEAIGVATLIMTGGQNLNFATPVSYVSNLTNQEKTSQLKGIRKGTEALSGFDSINPKDVVWDTVQVSEEVAHKGKVLFTADGGDSLYIKILENGVETWLLVMPAIVSVGDTIEFPSSVPMLDFQSKTMNTTFDKIYLPPWIRVVERGDKSSEEKYLYYVEQSLSMNNYYPTIGEINKAIEVNPNKAAYYAKRADLLLLVLNTFRYVKSANEQTLENNRKLCISALNDLDKAISLNPKDDSFYAKKAEALNGSYFCKYNDIDEVTKNDIDEVIKLYSSAININPGKADYHVKIGMAYKRKKEWGKVQEHAKKAISLDGKNKDAYYLYGSFYEENSNYNMALKYYAKGLGLNDFIVFSDPDIDRVMEKTKKYDDAIKIYSDLIKQHPDRIRNFIYGRAKYYVLAKNYKKAVADYTTLIKLEPDSEYNYFLRANSYYLDDKYEKALNDYRTACEMNHAYACNMVPVVEADLRRGTNWKIAASSSTVNFYYDKKGLTRNKNGVAITWVREEITNREQYIKDNEIEDYEKDKFQNVSYIMSRFEVDCPNQKLKVPISVTYAENGNVISSFENDKAQSINVIPNSIGSAIYEKMCKETPAKKAVKK